MFDGIFVVEKLVDVMRDDDVENVMVKGVGFVCIEYVSGWVEYCLLIVVIDVDLFVIICD